jgi:excisionase family DNA binding protein
MRLHEGQLSLLDVNEGSIEPTKCEPTNENPSEPTRSDRADQVVGQAACHESTDVRSERSKPAPAFDRGATTNPRRIANRRRMVSHDESNGHRELLEKHYKTRDVAELLSVHEETVLRLAQCGTLRSVRVGSERRYPESAIIEFLEQNADDTAQRLQAVGRRR